jgi:HAMP domain-containing protein
VAAGPIGNPPDLSGVLVIGVGIDDEFARTAREFTRADVSFVLDGALKATSMESARRLTEPELARLARENWVETPERVTSVAPAPALAAPSGLKVAISQSMAEANATRIGILRLVTALGAALLALAVLGGALVAGSLSRPIARLNELVHHVIATNDFTGRAAVVGRDEIAGLAGSFNRLNQEIQALLVATADKARMQKELETAKLVQAVGAEYPRIAASPGAVLGLLNRAVHESTRGTLQMTFFVAILDAASGEISFATASHEPAYLYHRPAEGAAPEGAARFDAFEALVVAPGPRLGDGLRPEYAEARARLRPGDLLTLYTDGLTEGRDPSGAEFGERKFLRAFLKHASGDAAAIRDGVLAEFRAHAAGEPLHDDITLAVCQYRGLQ